MNRAFMRWIYRAIVTGTVAAMIIPFAVMVSSLLWPLWAAAMGTCFHANYRARVELREGDCR